MDSQQMIMMRFLFSNLTHMTEILEKIYFLPISDHCILYLWAFHIPSSRWWLFEYEEIRLEEEIKKKKEERRNQKEEIRKKKSEEIRQCGRKLKSTKKTKLASTKFYRGNFFIRCCAAVQFGQRSVPDDFLERHPPTQVTWDRYKKSFS